LSYGEYITIKHEVIKCPECGWPVIAMRHCRSSGRMDWFQYTCWTCGHGASRDWLIKVVRMPFFKVQQAFAWLLANAPMSPDPSWRERGCPHNIDLYDNPDLYYLKKEREHLKP
jgi:predicted RNA-binding Zn-ribbon protein involved in translation (DUF1610 family)